MKIWKWISLATFSHREPSIYLLFWWLCAFEFDFLKWNPTNVRLPSRNGNVMWQVLNAGAGTSESAIALAILIVAPITLSLLVWFEVFKAENDPWGPGGVSWIDLGRTYVHSRHFFRTLIAGKQGQVFRIIYPFHGKTRKGIVRNQPYFVKTRTGFVES